MQKEKYLTILWVILIISWIMMMTFINSVSQELTISIVNIWTVMIFTWFIYKKRNLRNETLRDERTEKIASKSVWLSWFTTLIILNILFWLDKFSNLNFSTEKILWILIFIMIISLLSGKLYYNKKPC